MNGDNCIVLQTYQSANIPFAFCQTSFIIYCEVSLLFCWFPISVDYWCRTYLLPRCCFI